MSVLQKLNDDLKASMKAKDASRLACIRMVKSRVQEKLVSRRGKEGPDYELTDEEIVEVIGAYAKQRRDSIDQFRETGREEAIPAEEAELAILKDYLPEQLDEAAVAAIVDAAVEKSGASSPQDMGKVMGLVMPQVKGKADGKLVNRLVKERLTS